MFILFDVQTQLIYSEHVCVWRRWDAETGAARIDYHGGTASSYRQIVDGVVYRHMVGTAYFHSTTLLYV